MVDEFPTDITKGTLVIGSKVPNEELASNLIKTDEFVTSSTCAAFIAEIK